MTESLEYTVDDFRNDVGDLEQNELEDLAHYYPSYGDRWRPFIIEGIKQNKDNWQIVEDKLKALDAESNSDQSVGGLARNIPYKLRRAAYRIQYLRYRTEGYTRTLSNKKARQHFPSDLKADTFEVNTRGCILDKK